MYLLAFNKNDNSLNYYVEKQVSLQLTMYQSLLMALVSIPFCVLENWDLKK